LSENERAAKGDKQNYECQENHQSGVLAQFFAATIHQTFAPGSYEFELAFGWMFLANLLSVQIRS